MKKTFCITLALLFTLALSACDKTDSQAPMVSVPASGGQPGQSSSYCTFDPTLFDGKLQSCAYAGNGTLFVLADKLYLYDTAAASVLAETEAPQLFDFEVQPIDDGYILTGLGDDGAMAYVYDRSLSLNREIVVNELLTEDFVSSETGGIAATTDGKKLAIVAFDGLYLYDMESERLTTLLDMRQNAGTDGISVSILNGAAFACDNNHILFYGRGNSIPTTEAEDSFCIYGSINMDGGNLKLTKLSNYDIDEMQSSADRLFFPQVFTKTNGKLLWLDRSTGITDTLSFSDGDEGRDGVYSSAQGNYIATAVLNDSLTVRIYDVVSGELLATEVIENADSTYFYRIPRIYLLDEARTAVVVLGGSISEINTLVYTFSF